MHRTEASKVSLEHLQGGVTYTREYLFQEVLSRQTPVMQDCLLRTSVLDRFCPELCKAMGEAQSQSETLGLNGVEFVRTLQKENLFAIALDNRGRWFRYHHVFTDLLRAELAQRMEPAGIAALHERASHWYESQSLIEETIHHALEAGNHARAAEIFERHRYAELDRDRWYVVQRWLAMLPQELKQRRGGLLLAKAWILVQQWRLIEVSQTLDQAELLLAEAASDRAQTSELELYRCILLILLHGDARGARERLETLQKQITGNSGAMIAGLVETYLAVARQMTGDYELADKLLEERIYRTANSPGKDKVLPRLVIAQSGIRLLAGELDKAGMSARQLRVEAKRNDTLQLQAWSHYLAANANLQYFQVDKALQGFASALEQSGFLPRRTLIDAMAGLAITYQAMQRSDDAEYAMRQLEQLAGNSGDPQQMNMAGSCRARLSLLRGDLEPAVRWVRSYESPTYHLPSMLFWLDIPPLTRARVQVAVNTEKSLEEALQSLRLLRRQAESSHNVYQTIQIMVLQSVALDKQGRGEEELVALEKVVALSERLGWIWPFMEAVAPMAGLLEHLLEEKGYRDFVARLLKTLDGTGVRHATSATGASQGISFDASLAESLSLTLRELDILELLIQRLRNKEIARRLSISEETVKAHLKSIYHKLGVGNRRQAISRTDELQLFWARSRDA